MRVARFYAPGDIRIEDAPEPSPGPAEVKIRVVYFGLRTGGEQEEFQTYLRDGELAVTKAIRHINGRIEQKYFAATRQIPLFSSIRAMGKKEQIVTWNELVTQQTLPDIGQAKAKKAADVEEHMRAYEATHVDQMEWMEREEQFFGPKNVGGGKLTKLRLKPTSIGVRAD